MHISTTPSGATARYDGWSAIGHEFDEYLARLRSHLDPGTLEATLGLILSEYRTAIQKQRAFIGLRLLGRRDASANMKRLKQLEACAAAVSIARQDERVRRGNVRTDETAPSGNTVVSFRHFLAMYVKPCLDCVLSASILTELSIILV